MRDGIDIRKVRRIGLGALAVLVIVVAAVLALSAAWDNDPTAGPIGSPGSWISGPVLETAPQTDLAHYLAGKRRLIEGYAWVDKRAGIVRIPLDAAMHALAEQGETAAKEAQ